MSSTPFYRVPYLSNLKANASIQHQADFPPILEVKWQKVHYYTGTAEDIDITHGKFIGSTVDRSNPLLLINGVTFEEDYPNYYRCLARNSEGWGASDNVSLSVIGSMLICEFLLGKV